MTTAEKELQVTACSIRMSIIDATHGARPGHPGGSLSAVKKCGKVITCEEHSIIGGLGEAVATLLSEECPTPLRRIGVNDEFGHSGPAAAVLKQFGLCADNVVDTARKLCK